MQGARGADSEAWRIPRRRKTRRAQRRRWPVFVDLLAVERVGTGGVVGGVDDPLDLGQELLQARLDPLLQRDVHEAAAVTPPAEAQIDHTLFYSRQLDASTVVRDRGIDLGFQKAPDLLGGGPGQVGPAPRGDRRGGRRVGVLEPEPALDQGLAIVEARAPKPAGAFRVQDDPEASLVENEVAIGELVFRHGGEPVLEPRSAGTRLYPQMVPRW